MGIQKPGFLRKDALGPAHGRKKPGFEESECDRELSLLFGDWKSPLHKLSCLSKSLRNQYSGQFLYSPMAYSRLTLSHCG